MNYNCIESYLNNNKIGISQLLQALETKIIEEGRDNPRNPIPIYLTKWRIKSPESAFIKIKRNNKYKKIKDINDLAGMRILCLFEQDVLKTHEYLLKVIKEFSTGIEKFIIYNWHIDPSNDNDFDFLKKTFKKTFKDIKPEVKKKESGYKSIHYIIRSKLGNEEYNIEIQLRTIFQDAWAELEHYLSYKKGNIHPNIKKSFILLAKDLEINDHLISHLKDISDEEGSGEDFALSREGPQKYFSYSDDLIPKLFKKGQKYYDEYKEYTDFISVKRPSENCEEWLPIVEKKYNSLSGKFTDLELGQDKNLDYWKKMENAFIVFCKKKNKDAIDLYEDYKNIFPESYIIFFRLGELYFLEKNLAKALGYFDRSVELFKIKSKQDKINIFRIRIKLAYIYWRLGEEYLELNLKEINEAEKIYNENVKNFPKELFLLLKNNLCYYNLEKYIILKRDIKNNKGKRKATKQFKKAKKEFDDLLIAVKNKKNISSNLYDTIAWFYYQMYLNKKQKEHLKLAIEYCSKIHKSMNATTFTLTSISLQMKHIQLIMSTH